jgi:hypothetical protein
MVKLVINTNIFLKDAKKRRKNILKSQVVSFRLEGINIKSTEAKKIAEKIDKKFSKFS